MLESQKNEKKDAKKNKNFEERKKRRLENAQGALPRKTNQVMPQRTLSKKASQEIS